MKKTLCSFALVLAVALLAPPASAQTKPKSKAAASVAKTEPVHVISGVMQDNHINVQRSDWIKSGERLFTLTLTQARIANGKLEFTATLKKSAAKAESVTTTLAATNARLANPWPNAASPTARRRAATQSERDEVNEQTQSLHSATDTGSGCEVMFLKLTPPGTTKAMQLGVTLAHQDNARGNEINQALCRVFYALNNQQNADDALATLNRLLSRE